MGRHSFAPNYLTLWTKELNLPAFIFKTQKE